jgi:sulfur relay (sulfurtransferase) DsrF/TusC family protein
MLKLVRETCTVLSFLHDDCTLDKTRVQSVIFKFNKPYTTEFVLNSSTSPSAENFIDKDLTTLFNVSLNDFLNSTVSSSLNAPNLLSGVYELEYLILLKPTKQINSIINHHVLNGAGIYNEFTNTNLIYISGNVYEIDKTKSTLDSVWLKKPILNETFIYYPVYRIDESFVATEHLKKKMIHKIATLSTCQDCNNEAEALCMDVIALTSAVSAINCNDSVTAIEIINSLNNKYNVECKTKT